MSTGIVSREFTPFNEAMPGPEHVGKVFQIADEHGDPYTFSYAVWRGEHFTGVSDDPNDEHLMADQYVPKSLNHPLNHWRLVESA